jgi:hypothetical protein
MYATAGIIASCTKLLVLIPCCCCCCCRLQIHRTHALLMLLGSNNYLLQKMSSTVVSSLMTGTPIIADPQVLKSYTFLKPEHVHLMGPGETEMDVMQRVSNPAGRLGSRRALCGAGVCPLCVLRRPAVNGFLQLHNAVVLPELLLLPAITDHCGRCVLPCCCCCCCCQVLRMSPEEVFGVRQRVVELAEHLNRRTLQVLQTFMPMESDAAQAQVKKQ